MAEDTSSYFWLPCSMNLGTIPNDICKIRILTSQFTKNLLLLLHTTGSLLIIIIIKYKLSQTGVPSWVLRKLTEVKSKQIINVQFIIPLIGPEKWTLQKTFVHVTHRGDMTVDLSTFLCQHVNVGESVCLSDIVFYACCPKTSHQTSLITECRHKATHVYNWKQTFFPKAEDVFSTSQTQVSQSNNTTVLKAHK